MRHLWSLASPLVIRFRESDTFGEEKRASPSVMRHLWCRFTREIFLLFEDK